MNAEKLDALRIDDSQKKRPKGGLWLIFLLIFGLTAAAIFYAIPREGDDVRVRNGESMEVPTKVAAQSPSRKSTSSAAASTTSASSAPATSPTPAPAAKPGDSVLTVSGYIIARERIEISPRFMGVVNWIGIKKGDAVTNGQVMVLLDDKEYQARKKETEGRLAAAKASMEKAELNFQRVRALARDNVESKQMEDDMRLNVAAAQALVMEMEGQLALINAYIDWCVIKSPINGVVLEKLVDANELVTPQSFGGTRGPSTALVGLADLKDLQVEVDLNELDVAKVALKQRCKISPEAYPDKVYEGYVAEKAPEANRQKGTLQVKVQIENPDFFLTPELSAKVDFLQSK